MQAAGHYKSFGDLGATIGHLNQEASEYLPPDRKQAICIMSLLREIQAECTSKETDVTRILRLCLQLAARLNHASLREWVLHELNGYPDIDALPSYRVFTVRSRGHFADRLIGQATLDVPLSVLPEKLRATYAVARLGQPVSQYQSLIGKSGKGDGTLQLPWPMELAVHYASTISPMQCVSAWQELPVSAVVGMIDTVKTKVLSMALDLENADARAGDIPSSAMSVSEAKVSQIINMNIYGGQVQNLSAGSNNVSQSAGHQVIVGDLASLIGHLETVGVSKEEIEGLTAALEADAVEATPGMGRRVSSWLGGIAKRVGSTAAGMTRDTTVGVVTQAVLVYLGLAT